MLKFRQTLFLLLLCLGLNATVANGQQSVSVSGRISDTKGESLTGVTVLVKGTNNATITNIDGNYELAGVKTNSTLEVSYIGMISQEITVVDGKTVYNVTLKEDAISLNELVVIGYGTTTKKKLVGSVSSMNAEQLEQNPFVTLTEALQGQVPGLIIQANGGDIGTAPAMSIRGGEEPLFVIDDIISSSEDFAVLNPEDIEAISFLKDASSTAVYGAKAGAGIVLVKTKTGSKGDAKIRYSGNFQLSQPTMNVEMVDSYEFADQLNKYYDYAGSDPFMTQDQVDLIGKDYRYPNNDFMDLIYKDFSFSKTHNVSMSGGDEDTKYYVSLGYRDLDGIIETDVAGLSRTNFRSNVSHNFSKIDLKVQANLSGDVQDITKPANFNYASLTYMINPMVVCYNPDGTMSSADQNPLKEIFAGSGYDKKRRKSLEGQLGLTWSPRQMKGLSVGAMANYKDGDYYNKLWDHHAPSYSWNEETQTSTLAPLRNNPSMNIKTGYYHTLDFEARVAYTRSFGKHSVDALALYTQRTNRSEFVEVGRKDYVSAKVDQLFAGPLEGMTSDGYEAESASAGVVGRLKYDYAEKYIFEYSFRYDGSDQFAPGYRWGYFPAFSGVWIASDEGFMRELKEKDILNLLKIRASYGQTGLSTGVGRFDYVPSYTQTNFKDYAYIGGALQTGYQEGPLVNPAALSWYTRTSTNIGFDFASLDNSLEGSFDYFYYNTKGFLMSPSSSYSGTLGAALPKVSSNTEHRRAGIDFSLRYKKRIDKFYFEVGGNVSYYQQLYAVLDSEAEADLKNPYVRKTHETDYFDSMYLTDGLYQSGDEVIDSPRPLTSLITSVGEINYIDSNGDGKIDSNDRRRTGNSLMPHVTYGVNFNLKYDAWSLSGLVQGIGQRSVYIGNIYKTSQPNALAARMADCWSLENPDATFPRYFTSEGQNGAHQDLESDLVLFDGSYVRLKNLSLSYDLKKNLLKSANAISGLRVSLVGTNLLTFSEIFDYVDPESLMLPNAISHHRSGGGDSYPVNRTYSLAINIEF